MPDDLSLIGPVAAGFLASMLNKFENGMKWPSHLLQGKAAFLAKDPTKLDDPLSYRVLLLLPVVYRRWAAMRLDTMQD